MNDDEQKQLVTLLSKLEPGFLPYPIFKQIARLVVMAIIEVVPLRIVEGKVQVLLIERPHSDDIWPGELHTPGTVVRATDLGKDSKGTFDRILNEELDSIEVSDPYFVGTIFHNGKRGAEFAQIFWVEVLGEPKVGEFYDANDLPKNIMDQQLKFINQAIDSYKNQKGLK